MNTANAKLSNSRAVNACAALFLLIASSTAGAQSCAAPTVIVPISQVISGNSCGGNHVPTLANGMFDAPGDDLLYQFHIADNAPAQITFNLQPNAQSDLALALCTDPCGGSAACVDIADRNGVGGNESIQTNTLAPGNYYLIVDSKTASAPLGCGSFDLTITAPLND